MNNWNGVNMYRRPKFLEKLLEIRREMAHEADYDVDLFVEMARHGSEPDRLKDLSDAKAEHEVNGSVPDNRIRPSRT